MAATKSSTDVEDTAPTKTSETFRSIVSLVLVIHFFCVFVGITCVAQPFSPFQARLRYVLWPYTQLLSFDLEGKPYYLTDYSDPGVDTEEFSDFHADYRVEVLPAEKDPSDEGNWISLSDTGLRGGKQNKRYQQLARIMNELLTSDSSEGKTAASFLAQGVGNNYYARLGEMPQKIRVRVHLPQPRSWINSPNKERHDPNGPAYFRTITSFNVTGLMSDGKVGLTEEISAAEAATTDTPGPSRSALPGGGTSRQSGNPPNQ